MKELTKHFIFVCSIKNIISQECSPQYTHHTSHVWFEVRVDGGGGGQGKGKGKKTSLPSPTYLLIFDYWPSYLGTNFFLSQAICCL